MPCPIINLSIYLTNFEKLIVADLVFVVYLATAILLVFAVLLFCLVVAAIVVVAYFDAIAVFVVVLFAVVAIVVTALLTFVIVVVVVALRFEVFECYSFLLSIPSWISGKFSKSTLATNTRRRVAVCHARA